MASAATDPFLPKMTAPLKGREEALLPRIAANKRLPLVDDRYQFAHGSLLAQAQTAESLRSPRHPDYRRRIHRWVLWA